MKAKLFVLITFLIACTFVSCAQNTNTNALASIEALLRQKHDAITWGNPSITNGIQLGIAMFLKDSDGAKKFGTFTYLYNSNLCYGLVYPPHGYRLSLSLEDADGGKVELTKAGRALVKPIGIRAMEAASRTRSNRGFLSPPAPENYGNPFNILECFSIKKAGIYNLTVGATIYKLNNDGGVFPIVLPPTSMKAPINQEDIERHKMAE